MDASLATLPTHQCNTSVPYDIYHPLLQIAKLGYDANDVRCWYATIQVQLLHADTTYPVSTSESNNIGLVQSLEGTVSSGADTSTMHSLCASNSGDSEAFVSYDSYAANDISAASPFSAPSTYGTTTPAYDATRNLEFHSPPSYKPQTPFANIAQEEMSTSLYDTAHFATQSSNPYQWSHSERFDDSDLSPRKRRISQPTSYQTTMSSTAMPLLIPTTESSPSAQSSFLAPIYTSTEVMYLPPISVIPSRKRRKAGSKGVKKFIQPLHVSRQSI